MTMGREAIVERVARALCVVSGQDPDSFDACSICDRDSKPLPLWMAFEEEATAAIAAMPLEVLEGALRDALAIAETLACDVPITQETWQRLRNAKAALSLLENEEGVGKWR